MTKAVNLFVLLCLLSSPVVADKCAQISDANSVYKSITQSTASILSIKRLQQLVGVNADGIWGMRSEAGYNMLISKCNSYSYPGLTVSIEGAKIINSHLKKLNLGKWNFVFGMMNNKKPKEFIEIIEKHIEKIRFK